MKKLILILSVMSLISCQKEKIQNCMIGDWQEGSYTLKITDTHFDFSSGGNFTYTIINSGQVKFSNGQIDNVVCNGTSISLSVVSYGLHDIIQDRTYKKK